MDKLEPPRIRPRPTGNGDDAALANGKNGSTHSWDDPDWSILDDRRGELPEFPIDTVSLRWQDWIKRAAHGAGVTPAHVAVPFLGIASSLIGTARRVQASRSWTQPMTSWSATVGFSGTGKTSGIDVTKRALSSIERDRKTKVEEQRRAHDGRREAAKAAEKKWKEELKKAAEGSVVSLDSYRATANAKPIRPADAVDPGEFITPRLYVSDVTIERLAILLQARPQGMLLISDELAGLFLNMSRYSGGQDNEFWLEAWNGNSYTVERMSRPAIVVDYLLVGVVGGLQPDKLARSFKGDLDGMYARLLFSWPSEPAYQPLTNEVAEIEPEILNALGRIVDLEGGQGEDSGFAPRAVPLCADAVHAFERVRRFLDRGKSALDGREREWWAKMSAHILRLAGTLCYVEWSMSGGDEPKEIDAPFVEAATRLVTDYFWPHSRAALRQIGMSDNHANSRRVLRWVQASGRTEVSREEVRREALGQSLDADATQALLGGLVKAGWLGPPQTTPTKGRPAVRWPVNPKLLTPTAESAERSRAGGFPQFPQFPQVTASGED